MSDSTTQSLLINAIVAIVSFALGYTTHWYLSRRYGEFDKKTDTQTIITFVVLILWAVSVGFDMVSASYETPFALHGIFGAIVGFFYETSIKEMFTRK